MANMLQRVRENLMREINNVDMGLRQQRNPPAHQAIEGPLAMHRYDVEEMDIDDVRSSPSNESLGTTTVDHSVETLNGLRMKNLLCDGTVAVSDASFNVHRAILSACSDYFGAQFTGFGNATADPKVGPPQLVHVPGINGDIMNEILNFAYTRKCSITDENVHELLICADYLAMTGLLQMCKKHLARSLNAMNCVSIMSFARFRFLDDLYKLARSYVLRSFCEVAAKNNDILDVGVKDFYGIICDDELNTREEDIVWKLCVRWIDHDPENRMQHVAYLMTGVRLGLMTPKCFMDEVKDHPYVLQCEAAKPLIVDTFKFMYDLDLMNPMAGELTTPPLAMPRLPHEVIFAIGGWSGGTSKGVIETYDTRADRWVTISAEDPAGPRAYHGTAVLGFKLYVLGGYDGVEYFNTCRVFDTVSKRWGEIAPMHNRRCYVSVAELNGYIYAIGGYDGHNRLNTVERYNPKTNQWTLVTPMHTQRSDASACTLRGKIYATGGFNGQECLDSAEFYDPCTNAWTRIPNMNHRRSGVSCVAFHGQLYVIGGFNGTARLSTGERFNPISQTWNFIRQMNHSRSNFGLEIIDDMIFAIGGFNGVSTISHTECYVAENDEWMEATDMNVVRSALTANTVCGLPNKRDYIHKDRGRLMEDRRQRLLAGTRQRDSDALNVLSRPVVQEQMEEYETPSEEDDEPMGEDDDPIGPPPPPPEAIFRHLPAIPVVAMAQMEHQPQLNNNIEPNRPNDNRFDARAEHARRLRLQMRAQRFRRNPDHI